MQKLIIFLICILYSIHTVGAYFADGSCSSAKDLLVYSAIVKKGDTGYLAGIVRVFLLQNKLLTLEEGKKDDYSKGEYRRDYFGQKTENAIKKFQKSEGIIQTGIVGKKTREKIIQLSCLK